MSRSLFSKFTKYVWRRKRQPIPVFLTGEFHQQRSLADYSPWDRKKLDMTKQLTHTHTPSMYSLVITCRFDLFPHHGHVCQGNMFLTAWPTTWVSSSESSGLRFCFWLSDGRTATLPTTKVMSFLKCRGGGRCRVKGPWQRIPVLGDCTNLLLCLADCRS